MENRQLESVATLAEANREATRIFFRPDLTKAQQKVDNKPVLPSSLAGEWALAV